MQTPGELGAQAPVRTGACGSGWGPARTGQALGSAGDRRNRPAPIGALGQAARGARASAPVAFPVPPHAGAGTGHQSESRPPVATR